ncbi:MAG TPA: GNAT family N-acetyltransferase [Gammaproteobacteria bacterium]|nr:GNAT family N-acetyltransferase [Gammaproteobacteria bacterium]
MTGHGIEIRIVCPDLEEALAGFFSILRTEGAEAHFHPHPLTAEEARRLCHSNGRDLYYVLVEEQQVLGYGMLRGWDAGYDIPSLGIAIRRSARGSGLASLLMKFLHTAAQRRGATQIIMKVYRDNLVARRLYEHIGYTFRDAGGTQLLGSINL